MGQETFGLWAGATLGVVIFLLIAGIIAINLFTTFVRSLQLLFEALADLVPQKSVTHTPAQQMPPQQPQQSYPQQQPYYTAQPQTDGYQPILKD